MLKLRLNLRNYSLSITFEFLVEADWWFKSIMTLVDWWHKLIDDISWLITQVDWLLKLIDDSSCLITQIDWLLKLID